eukprot:UN13288
MYNMNNDGNDDMVAQHRRQFRKAVRLIKQEEKHKRNDYNHLMFLFKANNISYAVIDDVFHFAARSGLVGPKPLSGIHNIDEQMIFGSDGNNDFMDDERVYIAGEILGVR